MSKNTDNELALQYAQIVPTIDVDSHIVSSDLWVTIEAEISDVVAKIDSNADLEPADVKRVQSLKTQVDEYVTTFNRSMRAVQTNYKSAIEKRLDDLGYTKVDTYVKQKRQEQTKEQNERTTLKLEALTQIINLSASQTQSLKHTVLAPELVPFFYNRFPKVKSAAKANEINDWEPYVTVVVANLTAVDEILTNPQYAIAQSFPIHSATMQQLSAYLKTGDIELLDNFQEVIEKDAHIVEQMILKQQITSKEVALQYIANIASSEGPAQERLTNISKIMGLAMTLTQ